MKILFLAPYVPSRIRVRPFQIILELAKRHHVHVIALAEGGGGDLAGVEELRTAVESFHIVPHSRLRGPFQSLVSLPTRTPMCAAYCWSPAMERAVRRAVASGDFDVVHIEHLRAAHLAGLCGPIPKVIDSVDCLTGLFSQMARSSASLVSRLVMREETWKLRRYEPRLLARFDRIVITSDIERDALLSLSPNLQIDTVPNGVDTGYFAPQAVERRQHRIVFSGKMSYDPNAQAALWFAESVLPALREKHPDVQFVVVGSKPPPEVTRLADLPGVSVTGYVDDIRPYLASASVAVVPMQVAVGVQNKVLEAMAMGLPIVVTPIAARAFRTGCPGVLEAGSVEDMTHALSQLLEDPCRAEQTGRQGRDEVLRSFAWSSSVGKLESAYDQAIRSRRRS